MKIAGKYFLPLVIIAISAFTILVRNLEFGPSFSIARALINVTLIALAGFGVGHAQAAYYWFYVRGLNTIQWQIYGAIIGIISVAAMYSVVSLGQYSVFGTSFLWLGSIVSAPYWARGFRPMHERMLDWSFNPKQLKSGF